MGEGPQLRGHPHGSWTNNLPAIFMDGASASIYTYIYIYIYIYTCMYISAINMISWDIEGALQVPQ